MSQSKQSSSETGVVRGEFYTDGKSFVLRLKDSPLSGVGATADAAFNDLIRAEGEAGVLAEKLERLARDQEGEQVRATLIRVVATWLIALTIVGGLLAGMVAVAPKLAADLAAAGVRATAASSAPATPAEEGGQAPPAAP